MSRNVFTLRTGERLIKDDFADAIIAAPTTKNAPPPRIEHRRSGLYYVGPFHEHKIGRLYLTDQRFVQTIWPHYSQVFISRKLERSLYNRLFKPMVLIDIPLSAIAEISVGGIFKNPQSVTLTVTPGYVQISASRHGQEWKNLNYQPEIMWNEWESAFNDALAAQHLRLTKAPVNPNPLTPTNPEDMEKFFQEFTNGAKWKVERTK